MTFKDKFKVEFDQVDEADSEESGHLPIQKQILAVLLSIDKHLNDLKNK